MPPAYFTPHAAAIAGGIHGTNTSPRNMKKHLRKQMLFHMAVRVGLVRFAIPYNVRMAIESRYLRKKIKYQLTSLEKYTKLADIPDDKDDRVDEYYSAVEIKVIEICSLMRKMDDLGKMPDGTLSGNYVPAERFKSRGPVSQRAYVDMEKEYDFENPMLPTRLSLRTICNIVIHSYVLQAMGDEDKAFRWILATSDFTQFKGLYMIDLVEFIKGFRSVVDLYPSQLHAYYDQEKQKWVHSRK